MTYDTTPLSRTGPGRLVDQDFRLPRGVRDKGLRKITQNNNNPRFPFKFETLHFNSPCFVNRFFRASPGELGPRSGRERKDGVMTFCRELH